MSDREKCCDSRRLFFGRPGVCGFVPILRVCTSAKHDCKARSGTVVLEREFYATMLNSAHADRHDTNKPAGHFLKCQPSCTHSCNSEPPACGHRLGLDRLENGWTWDMVVVLGGRWSLLLCCGCCRVVVASQFVAASTAVLPCYLHCCSVVEVAMYVCKVCLLLRWNSMSSQSLVAVGCCGRFGTLRRHRRSNWRDNGVWFSTTFLLPASSTAISVDSQAQLLV